MFVQNTAKDLPQDGFEPGTSRQAYDTELCSLKLRVLFLELCFLNVFYLEELTLQCSQNNIN